MALARFGDASVSGLGLPSIVARPTFDLGLVSHLAINLQGDISLLLSVFKQRLFRVSSGAHTTVSLWPGLDCSPTAVIVRPSCTLLFRIVSLLSAKMPTFAQTNASAAGARHPR